tara:strand:+ start:194 stop:1333 length:1140 start_codon:yes stop_codon:yes gene_type:complete
MSDKISTFFISVGEPSGDIHAAKLVLSLKKISPNIKFIGNGGDKMIEAGVNVKNHIDKMSIMGFVEVLKNYNSLSKIFKNTVSEIKTSKPDKILLVDYPGFNLRLVKKIKNLDIPITYFILPQTWAWKENRILFMKKTISNFISIFPFETNWYNSKGLKTYYPGHPFLDNEYGRDKDNQFLKKHNLKNNDSLLVLLPGSRQQEINYHWPIFLEIIFLLKNELPSLRFCLVKSSNVIIKNIPDFIIIEPSATNALKHGTAAISSSGTVNLECALAKVPTIVCYKTSYINWIIFKIFGKVDFISIVNLIVEEKIIPEFIQNEMTSKKMLPHLLEYLLPSSKARRETIEKYKNIRTKLGSPGVFDRAAKHIISEKDNEKQIR